MTALVRYVVTVMLQSQRFLLPLMVVLGAGIMLTVGMPTGPVGFVYGPAAGALFVGATWFTMALVAAEDPVRRTITSVNSGGSRSVLIATVLVAVAACLAVSVVLLVLPVLIGSHQVTATDLAVGLLACLAGGATGVAIGLATSRLVIARTGYALLTALALVAAFGLVRGLPPINTLLRLLSNGEHDVLPTTALYAGIAVVLLGLSTALTQFVSSRRD